MICLFAGVVLGGVFLVWVPRHRAFGQSDTNLTPLRQRIVALAQSQVGYRTNPRDSYCNKFSAYWSSGSGTCPSGELDEEWCADFAAWAWHMAGAEVVYQYINGDLNSSSASFYEWGEAHGTWHPVGSGYVPQPGDVAVYGLDAPALVAEHVAIVVGYSPGAKGPTVIDGDGDRTGFSVVEGVSDQYVAYANGGTAAALSGYVAPSGS
jgi:CHAP domain